MPEGLGFIHEHLPGSGQTLVLLHGTGGDERSLIDLGRVLDPAAALLSPRGKSLDEGYPRFFRRFSEGVFDLEDLQMRAKELADFIHQAKTLYELPGHLIAVGYSNGANIATACLLLRPATFDGVIALRGQAPLHPEPMPKLYGKRYLLISGRQDPIVPAEDATELSLMMQQAGAAVEHEWLPAGHGIVRSDIDLSRRWLGVGVEQA